MKKTILLLLLSLTLSFTAACGASTENHLITEASAQDMPTSTDTSPDITSTPDLISKATATPEPTIVPTPTLEPTPTLKPTPAPTPMPTLTPTEQPIEENVATSNNPEVSTTIPEKAQSNNDPTNKTPVSDSAANSETQEISSSSDGNSSGNGSNFNTYNNPEQQNTEAAYVLNTNTMKIHHPTCKSVKKIAPQNYSTSNSSLDELKSQGYTTCGNCFK